MNTLEKECPKGKILNKKTNRCVSIDGAIGKNIMKTIKNVTRDCPPGKIMNVKTKRCVSITGAIGKLLQKSVAHVDKKTNTDIFKHQLLNNKVATNLELVDAVNFALAKRLILSTRLAMCKNSDKNSAECAVDFPFGMFFRIWAWDSDFVIVNGLYKSVKYTLSFPTSQKYESLVYMTVYHRDEIHCLEVSTLSSTVEYARSSFTNTYTDMFPQMTTMLIDIFQDILHFKNASKFIKVIVASKKVKPENINATRPKIEDFKVLKTTPKDVRHNVGIPPYKLRFPHRYIDARGDGVLFKIRETRTRALFAKFDFSIEGKDIRISFINFENRTLEIILFFHTETNKFANISEDYAIKDLTRDWKKTYEIAMAYKTFLKSAKSNGNINQEFHDFNWDSITLEPYCIRSVIDGFY
jgi:hypothetical protein